MSFKEKPLLRWAQLPECESIKDAWQVKAFTEVAEVIAGQSPPSETYNDKGLGLPFLQGNADFSDKHPKPSSWCDVPQKTAIGGDVLFSVRAPVGEMNLADQEYAIGRGLAAIRAVDIDKGFLYHGLQRWRWSLQRVAQGTTFDAVTARHFRQLRIAIPSGKDEQAAIARILDAVDTAIERARAAVEQAKELKAALIQDFFYSALGVTAYANRPTKKLPVGWSLAPTQNLLAQEPKNGVSPQASSHPPGIPTFSIAAVREGRVNLENTDNLKYTQLPDKIANQFKINRGDMLIVRGNANPDLVGKAGMVDTFPKYCIYPDITKRVVFQTEGELAITPEFAVLAWNHPILHNQILRRAKTSNGTLKINNRDVKQIVMPVPPLAEQTKLVELVAAVNAKIDALKQIQQAQTELKKSLMHDLLTGAVRVR